VPLLPCTELDAADAPPAPTLILYAVPVTLAADPDKNPPAPPPDPFKLYALAWFPPMPPDPPPAITSYSTVKLVPGDAVVVVVLVLVVVVVGAAVVVVVVVVVGTATPRNAVCQVFLAAVGEKLVTVSSVVHVVPLVLPCSTHDLGS
jgi:hypothetical protein